MPGRMGHICGLLITVFVLAACVQTATLETVAPRATVGLTDTYLLGPGDEMNIVVYYHEDLSARCSGSEAAQSKGCAVVSDSGTIALPLVGEIRVEGKTVEEVRQEYTARLSEGYLVNPYVTINIHKYRPFFIIGGVRQPGAYPYRKGMTILHAIALAGGHSNLAIKNRPPLVVRMSGASGDGDTISVFSPVYPGDVVEIPELPPLR